MTTQSQDHTKPLVLIVEDDSDEARILTFYLNDDFDVAVVHSYDEAKQWLALQAPALIVLDIQLGDDKEAGFRLCHDIRHAPAGSPLVRLRDVMILMLTQRPEASRGLNDGADDYLRKPYNRSELVARVRARVRRTPTSVRQHVLECFPLKIDTKRQEVTVNDLRLEVTRQEYKILYLLMHADGAAVSRNDLQGYNLESRTIDQTIYILRQKLKAAYPGAEKVIQAVRGRGYRIVALYPEQQPA
jgi:DNA-binding response OmpR family regulator